MDIINNVVVGLSHNATAATTNNTAGSSVDFVNAENPATVFSAFNANATTAPSVSLKVQESTDGTTWADITGATIAAATTSGLSSLQFNRSLRYLRSFQTSGTSATFGLATLFLGQKKYAP
jgi:hypothetical protein